MTSLKRTVIERVERANENNSESVTLTASEASELLASYDAMREALEHCYKYMTGAVTAPSAVSCIKEAKAALAQQEVSHA